jgi:hypothetical protein
MTRKAGKREKEKKIDYVSSHEVQKLLIENFAGLQKAMTNLAIKFEGLSAQIGSLLEVFELSARSFVGQGNISSEDNKDILSKIDSLLTQNKVLAKGLVTLEEKLKQKNPSNFNAQIQRKF